jgi:Raf kinase inhibitor-like YbhB/YbcL family protein
MPRATPWSGVAAAAAAVAVAAVAVAVGLAGCGGGDKVSGGPPAAPARLRLTSPAFGADATIPTRFTCAGAGARPALRFAGVPAAANELALLVIDPDAGGFVHWTVYAIDPGVRGLGPSGLPPGAREGRSSTGETGWTPPCPPPGSGTHRYQFELYWLRERSGLDAGADPQHVVDAIRAGAGGRGELVGRFGRGD